MRITWVNILAGLLLTMAFAPAAQAMPGRATSAPVAGTVDGLALSIHLPPGPYFRNELIRVTVEARNVGTGPVPLVRYLCPNGNLFAKVQNGSGRTVYPPAVSGPPAIHCPAPIGTTLLRPGARLQRRMLIILRGRYVRAVTFTGGVGTGGYIAGPATTLALRRGAPLQVMTQTEPYELVTIKPSGPTESGPLLYQESSLCRYPEITSGATGSGTITTRWERAPIGKDGYTFEPPCPQHVEWHLVAGWVGPSVASISYNQP